MYRFLITCISLIALLGAQVVGAQAVHTEKSTKQIVEELRKSPQFVAEFDATRLEQRGMKHVSIGRDVRSNMADYVRSSSFRAQPHTKALFSQAVQANYLQSAPAHSEKIIQLKDQLVIDRELRIKLKPGICRRANLPIEIKNHCFVPKAGSISQEVRAELQEVRSRLASLAPSTKLAQGVTAAKARHFNDRELLDLILNGSERKARLVSVVPSRLEEQVATRSLPSAVGDGSGGTPVLLPRKYFLTGFTLGRQHYDNYEYVLAEATSWHGRYYLRFYYYFDNGFGVRWPFAVDVTATPVTGFDNAQGVKISVQPVDVDGQGNPAYPAVGLDRSKYFSGNELVLQVNALCGFYASIPGKDIDIGCPSVGRSWSRDLNPVLGSARSEIGTWWLRGGYTGLGFSAGIGFGYVDLGVRAVATDGEVGLTLGGNTCTAWSGLDTSNMGYSFSRSTSDPINFRVWSRASPYPCNIPTHPSAKSYGFTIHEPRYGFNLVVSPLVQLRIGVDLGVYEYSTTVGPYWIDSLSVSTEVPLEVHAGTIQRHSYLWPVN